MKFPLSWLKKYLPTKLEPLEIAETLTQIGLEIDSVSLSDEDPIFELSLTPNLAHCASIRGVARELAAITQEEVLFPQFTVSETQDPSIDKVTSVIVENVEGCPRYSCRVIVDVKVAPSPDWLQKWLEQCGMRCVNNIVDITNFVLLEMGHPLHAFDLDQLEENRIVVRQAKKNESITTLDGKEHFPTEEALLICDAKKPIAIAGIMGGLSTEVSEKTTRILLESAYFEPRQIRRTSKHLGIKTEASFRFERGGDPNGTLNALERASQLICEITGGIALHGTIDVFSQPFPPRSIVCRLSRVNQILGTQLSMSEVESIFRRLGLAIESSKNEKISVSVPTYRYDLMEEIDLIEEVARLYGYDNIHNHAKTVYRTGELFHSPIYLFEKKVRELLLQEGLQEFLTCNLISPFQASVVSPDSMPQRSLIKLLNPHSNDQSILRPSLFPGLLQTVKYNADHQIHTLSGFEIGKVYFKAKEGFLESTVFSIVQTGERAPVNWEKKSDPIDFFDLKGIIENICYALKIPPLSFIPSHFENFHPGRQAAITAPNGVELGFIGEVHPSTLKKFSISNRVYFAELNFEDLKRLVPEEKKMIPLPQYPSTSRDWTLTLKADEPISTVFDLIRKAKSELLETFLLINVYQDEKLGNEWKNVTFHFVYRDYTKTISVEAAESEHNRICQGILNELKKETKVKI